jgi:hypothetical protein
MLDLCSRRNRTARKRLLAKDGSGGQPESLHETGMNKPRREACRTRGFSIDHFPFCTHHASGSLTFLIGGPLIYVPVLLAFGGNSGIAVPARRATANAH